MHARKMCCFVVGHKRHKCRQVSQKTRPARSIARWKPRRSLVASMLVIHACLIAAATSSPPDAMHIFAANAALLMPAHDDVDASPEEISIVSAQSFNSCEEVRAAGACEHPLAQAHCKVSCPQPDLSNFWRARDKTV